MGNNRHVPLRLHLRTCPEALVPGSPRALHKSGWDMDCERDEHNCYGLGDSHSAHPADLEAAIKEVGKDCVNRDFQSRILVSSAIHTLAGKGILTECSVVFASVYRFTVLFSYRASDPTYTLANTVGWTAIEMSAGITSACLPTIQPAIHFIARKLGLLKFIESSVLSRNGRSTQNGAVAPETTPRHEHPTKVLQGEGAFYRLSDRNGSAQSEEVDIKLRPEHGYVYTVSSELGNGNTYSSGDEIPLNRIGVQTDFKQTRN